jgi:hypothetical protein
MYESKDNFQDDITETLSVCGSIVSDNLSHHNKKSHYCEMCNTESRDSSFVILGCNHSFHINCLANNHHNQAKKCHILDDEFFNSRKCTVCKTQLDSSEIMYIHSKYSKATFNLIATHDVEINKLERQINKLKEEMKTALEYKQKLEFDREKSKQIIVMLNLTL